PLRTARARLANRAAAPAGSNARTASAARVPGVPPPSPERTPRSPAAPPSSAAAPPAPRASALRRATGPPRGGPSSMSAILCSGRKGEGQDLYSEGQDLYSG